METIIYQSELQNWARDSKKSIMSYKRRKFARKGLNSLGNIPLWSILLMTGTLYSAQVMV